MDGEGIPLRKKSIQGWTLNLNQSDKKVTTKNSHSCFKIKSMFWTSVHGFFPNCRVHISWFESSKVKLYRNDLKGNRNYFELVGSSSY